MSNIQITWSAKSRSKDGSLSMPQPLSDYNGVHAWVLLADPGAGKSNALQSLCDTQGGHYVLARDFVDLTLPNDWTEPLFIDGLDEVSAGQGGRSVLGAIRGKLQALDMPKFRIACREADWRGQTDSADLQRLVGDDRFVELHLDALTRVQTRGLVAFWQAGDATRADAFLRDAEDRDLGGLLDNPQSLYMLVKAVEKNGVNGLTWPENKTKTYELACKELAQEQSDAHRDAARYSPVSEDEVLQAAGFLSAVFLLSGSTALSIQSPREGSGKVVALTAVCNGKSAPDLLPSQAALASNLFRSTGSGEFVPVHRTVAEYLGAIYVADRIQKGGLPANRVLALMLGEDGGIVPELRGLHAWLAAVAPSLRRDLIARDPLGVVLNGDVRAFSRAEKLQVLGALRTEANRYAGFRNQNWASNPFGALATVDMEEDFRALLQSPDRSAADMALLDCVLDAMKHGQAMPALSDALDRVVRDKNYWPGLRRDALATLALYAKLSQDFVRLSQLLADVDANLVDDADDDLLGLLLGSLYPGVISAGEIWGYFRPTKNSQLIGGRFDRFWQSLAGGALQNDALPVMLDSLCERGYYLKNNGNDFNSCKVIGSLLVAGLIRFGLEVPLPRLSHWLSLGVDRAHAYCLLDDKHKNALADWLFAHPVIYKALFESWFNQTLQDSRKGFKNLWVIAEQLFGAPQPVDAADWYLSMAQGCEDEDARQYLLHWAFQWQEAKAGASVAIQMLSDWSSTHVRDQAWVGNFLQCEYPPSESIAEMVDSDLERKARLQQESRQEIAFFNAALPSFKDGPAQLGALSKVADAYLQMYRRTEGNTPIERLQNLLNHNSDWVDLALHGLRQTLRRDDLPCVTDIVSLRLKNQRYGLEVPCLAAMALRYSDDADTAFELSSNVLETVIAFGFLNHQRHMFDWFKVLPIQRHDVVAHVLQTMIPLQIAAKKGHVDGLYQLAHDATYAAVAKEIVPALLQAFPLKASGTQLPSLRQLIVAMQNTIDDATQGELIAAKLNAPALDVAQQVYWLIAGVQLAPEVYLESAEKYVEASQRRIGHVFDLVHECRATQGKQVLMSVAAQAFLVRLLGPTSHARRAQGVVTRASLGLEAGEYVEWLVNSLASNPDDAATQALTTLMQRPDLKHWHDTLTRAIYEQRITRRKALFKSASVVDVCATLGNLKPANTADLWALTVDHLLQLAGEIRNGSTNDYRQYWAGEAHKNEDDCCDALLSDLKVRLASVGVMAEPEGRYADMKRADIKMLFAPYHVPIEIKGEWHKSLWTAIPEQLIAKYGREAASDGYGIYLVFWFSGQFNSVPIDGGAKPKTPQELQQRLVATVPEALRHKIAVVVVDCGKATAGATILDRGAMTPLHI